MAAAVASVQAITDVIQITSGLQFSLTLILMHIRGRGVAETGGGEMGEERRKELEDGRVGHAPCYECEMYNVMQHDHPLPPQRKVSTDIFRIM